MNNLVDTLLTTVDRLSSRITPVDSLVTILVGRIAPQIRAAAGSCNDCNPPAGYSYCCGVSCVQYPDNMCGGSIKEEMARYAPGFSLCAVQYVECWIGCC